MESPIDYKHLAECLGVKGQRAGAQIYARCPLHRDRRPSFTLNTTSGLWICFTGCGHGTFDRLVQEVLGCTAREAECWILENNTTWPEIPVVAEPKPRPPGDYYSQCQADVLPEWFLDRGFSWDTARRYQLRWDPLRRCLVIPVLNEKSLLVGYIQRHSLPQLPKYQNSPGLPRNSVLFGLPQASGTSIILVEGPLDAMWLTQCGYPAVALMGTQLSTKQLDLLRTYYGSVLVGLDNDEPGQESQVRILKQLTLAGWLDGQLCQIHYPQGKKDAQDCEPAVLEGIIKEAVGGRYQAAS